MASSTTALPRVFIVHAPQDAKYAELIISRASSDRVPVGFDRFGEGRIDEVGWQLECRRRIRSARAVVVLLSANTSDSPRAMWQVKSARELGLPIVGLTLSPDESDISASDESMAAVSIVGWRWKTIVATLMRLAAAPVGAAGARVREVPTHGSAA